MQFACGKTRFVILHADTAYKIGRLRPLRLLERICVLPFSRCQRRHFLQKYGPGYARAAWYDLCAGLYANRTEAAYFRETHDPRVMPIRAHMLGGWIITQDRGTPIEAHELCTKTWNCQFDTELAPPQQFCRKTDGCIVLVDYGKTSTTTFLRNT